MTRVDSLGIDHYWNWRAERHNSGALIPILNEFKRGLYLRRLARIASACTVLFFATFAGAQIQQMDIAVGYGRLLAFEDLNASQAT